LTSVARTSVCAQRVAGHPDRRGIGAGALEEAAVAAEHRGLRVARHPLEGGGLRDRAIRPLRLRGLSPR
jgi:hypothetical protein